MDKCSIDAVYHGEERYSKLSLAYANEEEKSQIEKAFTDASTQCSLKPHIYTSDISGGRQVMVIEYHDDYDREAGNVFDTMLKTLGIDKCS